MKTEIIPVIHMVNHNRVMTNVRTCRSCGVNKVFLINHHVSVEDLIICAIDVKKSFPNLWVGINMLGRSTEDSLLTNIPVDGLWCDASISPYNAKLLRNFTGMFFGGLAFKYQPQPKDSEELKKACQEAALATDVATTSGPGTAKAANVDNLTKQSPNLICPGQKACKNPVKELPRRVRATRT